MHRHVGVLVIISALVAAPACVNPDAHREVLAANEALQLQITDLESHHRDLEAENLRLSGEVERLGRNAAEADFVRAQKEELARLIQEFQSGGAREVPGVKVIQTAEGVGFQMQGEVLFSSGQAVLTASGETVLGQLVPALREHRTAVRIDGHTDSDPIRRSPWKTNLRLSSERAMAVAQYMIGRGIPAEQLHVAAFGEHRPAVEGSDDAAKRQNRRVEIMLLRQ